MISIEMVEALRKLIDIDYRLAEKALRKGRGTVDGAVLWLKKRDERWMRRFWKWSVKAAKHCWAYTLYIHKDEKTVFDLPILLVIALLLVFDVRRYQIIWILFVVLLLTVISKSSIKINSHQNQVDEPLTSSKKGYQTENVGGIVLHTENDIPIIMQQTCLKMEQKEADQDIAEQKSENNSREHAQVKEDEEGFHEVLITQ